MLQNNNQIIRCSEHEKEEMTKQQRLLCKECINKMEGNYRFIGIEKIKQIIYENQNQKKQIINNAIDQRLDILQKFQYQIDQFRSQQIQKFDNLLSQTNLWKQSLNEIKTKYQQSNFTQEFDRLLENDLQFRYLDEQQIYKDLQQDLTFLIQTYQPKITLKLNELMNVSKLFQTNYSIFECFQNEEIQTLRIGQITPKVEIKQMNEIENQDEWCYAIQFDKKGQKMISTSNKDIKVWSFIDGKLLQIQQLKGHLDNVTCLLYTHQSDCIISGSQDQTLRCWSMNDQNQLISNPHSKSIVLRFIALFQIKLEMSLYLQAKINQLKYGSLIQIQKVYNYNNHQQNTKIVFTLNLVSFMWKGLIDNYLEKRLVKQMAIQLICYSVYNNKEQINQYNFYLLIFLQIIQFYNLFKNTQSIQDFGKKIHFLNEDQLIWVTANNNLKNNSIWVFESRDGVIMENQEKTIHLDEAPNFDYVSFPIQYNKEKNLLIVRHKSIIYLLRQSCEGKFIIFAKLPCQDENSYGALSPDGKYLVFWDCIYQKPKRSNGKYLVIELIYY